METRWSRYSERYKQRYAEDRQSKLNKNKSWKEENPNKFLYNSAKQRAKKGGIEFDLEPEDIIVPHLCPVFNLPMEFATRYSPSIDRIDNCRGYVKGNIVVISMLANRMKNSATKEELSLFCSNIKKVLYENK